MEGGASVWDYYERDERKGMTVGIYKTRETAQIPEYATSGSAAFDIRACLKRGDEVKVSGKKLTLGDDSLWLSPGEVALIPTGLIFNIPDGYVLKLFARSSLPLKRGLALGNSVAIIDSDYVEETFVMIHNFSDAVQTIDNDERIAQGIFEEVIPVDFAEMQYRPGKKTDRQGGMGSTGRK